MIPCKKPLSDYPSLRVLLRADEALCDLAHPHHPCLNYGQFSLFVSSYLLEFFKYCYLFFFSGPPFKISIFPIVSIALSYPLNQFQPTFSLVLQDLVLLIPCLVSVYPTGYCMLCKQMQLPDTWLWNIQMINSRIFLNRLYFLDQFQVNYKTEQEVQRFPIYSLPPHMHSLCHYLLSHESDTLFN